MLQLFWADGAEKGRVSSDESAESTPAPKSTPKHKKTAASSHGEEQPAPTPAPKKSSSESVGESDATRSTAKAKAHPKGKSPATPAPDEGGDSDAPAKSSTSSKSAGLDDAQPSEAKRYFPPAILASADLAEFSRQPERVQHLIEAALDLTKQNLTYTYGSADPSSGGMDCSGTIYYLLKHEGFNDVPRDSSGQYAWVRRHGQFFAVISRKAGGFEFSELLPGDLLFWNGTYTIDRDPPVTHTMIYLGTQRRRNQPVMWGSSDGRSFDGKQRWGVSAFDFTMPKAESSTPHALFLGYGRIPGLRAE